MDGPPCPGFDGEVHVDEETTHDTNLSLWDTCRTLHPLLPARLADTIQRYRAGILAWFRHRITTGPLEGLDNKIKVLKRQAYGFRDMVYFELRLYFIHEATSRLSG